MTLNEAIIRCDLFCSNDAEREIKVKAISTLEKRLIKEVLSTFPDIDVPKDFNGYDADADGGKELLAESPYDEMYGHYAAAEVYLIMHEQKHYNNEIHIFNSLLADYKVYLYKNHRPGGVSRYRVR